jgi:pyrroloquinoline quinone biosynthesis protein E
MSETAKVDGSRRPVWLYSVLTYRCPLACATCHDPLDHERFGDAELDTAEWTRVLGEARALGALQVAFCGGEPAMRDDLEDLVAEASRLGFYGNLITGGGNLDASRLSALKRAGLNQVRLNLPSSSAETTALLCGAPALESKLACARDVKAAGLALGLTVPVCRQNIDQTEDLISLAEDLGADFLEFAEVRPVHLVAVNQAALLGTDWMKPPCRSCDDQSVDFGGCRCQAFRLTGDPANADPACCRSSRHILFRAEENVAWTGETSLDYRRDAKELVT